MQRELISSERIKENLAIEYKCLPIHVFSSIDSTNSEAKRMDLSDVDVMLLISEEQLSGRGRLGRSFYSPKNTGIYMSLVLRINPKAFENPMLITLKAAIAVSRSIESLTGAYVGVKWVNDIYIGNRKIAGILAEGIPNKEGGLEHVVVGIGINVTTETFPDDIKNKAASIQTDISRNELAAAIVNELLPLYEDLEDTSFMDEYRAKSIVIGKNVSFEEGNESRMGVACGIADNGGLLVKKANGEIVSLTNGIVEMVFD